MISQVIVSILLIVGSSLILLSAIGVYKFPKTLIKLHSSSKASTLGVGFIFLALGLMHNQLALWIKIFLALIFLFLSGPMIAYLFAKVLKD